MKEVIVTIHIKKNSTGEVKEHQDTLYEDDNGFPSVFIWEFGNFACDCNRAIFFGDSESKYTIHCGHTEYSVNIFNGRDCIYREFEQ